MAGWLQLRNTPSTTDRTSYIWTTGSGLKHGASREGPFIWKACPNDKHSGIPRVDFRANTQPTAAVFWFCARHPSGEDRDILLLEKLVMTLPLVMVPLVFATVAL